MEEYWSKMRYMIILVSVSCSIQVVCSSPSLASTCHPQSNTFLTHLHLQCPFSISFSPPIQMDEESFELAMSSKPGNVYTAIVFYGSRCPFSSSFLQKFQRLSSLFPQAEHIQLEQSSVTPSLFSRYGIHSLPALLILNQTSKVRHYGPKDLKSLAHFYKRTTGLDPVYELSHDNCSGSPSTSKSVKQWYEASSWKEMMKTDGYLMFSMLFLIMRVFLFFCPQIWSRVLALWDMWKSLMNMGVLFEESRQLVGRVVHLVDLKRVWSKLNLGKTGDFRKGATRSVGMWASSLASVSLGKTSASSARSLSSMQES